MVNSKNNKNSSLETDEKLEIFPKKIRKPRVKKIQEIPSIEEIEESSKESVPTSLEEIKVNEYKKEKKNIQYQFILFGILNIVILWIINPQPNESLLTTFFLLIIFLVDFSWMRRKQKDTTRMKEYLKETLQLYMVLVKNMNIVYI